MNKAVIKNRNGQNIVCVIDRIKEQVGIVFLVHGHGSHKEHYLLTETADVFKKKLFTSISFDMTNSIGESDGELENGTPTSYYKDLEDVINWAQSQDWYKEPFFLVGHSLGGYCVSRYAINNKEKVKKLVLFNPFISGEFFIKTDEISPILKGWKEVGIREWESSTYPGIIKRVKYDFIEDGLKHDLLRDANKIACPVLLISSEEDRTIPLEYQRFLFDRINTNKIMYIASGQDHNLKDKKGRGDVLNIVDDWI